jgi:hypothetical protein
VVVVQYYFVFQYFEQFGVELVIGVELARAKTEPWPFRGASSSAQNCICFILQQCVAIIGYLPFSQSQAS